MLEDEGIVVEGEHYDVEETWYGETDIWGWPESEDVHY